MTDGPYLVQCISGIGYHTKEVIPGTELEAKCIARAKAGKIDALVLYYDQCPECIYDSRMKAEKDYSVLGCPGMDIYDNCVEDCTLCAQRDAGIPDSIYQGQMQIVKQLAFAA